MICSETKNLLKAIKASGDVPYLSVNMTLLNVDLCVAEGFDLDVLEDIKDARDCVDLGEGEWVFVDAYHKVQNALHVAGIR